VEEELNTLPGDNTTPLDLSVAQQTAGFIFLEALTLLLLLLFLTIIIIIIIIIIIRTGSHTFNNIATQHPTYILAAKKNLGSNIHYSENL